MLRNTDGFAGSTDSFFTGKVGVGKTSLSCATGLALANEDKRVLIVSTDPASNPDEVLGTTLSSTPTLITGTSGLYALNIDPEKAAYDYRERMDAPYRGILGKRRFIRHPRESGDPAP